MSFTDRPALSGLQKLGCVLAGIVGLTASIFAFFIMALGSCYECDPNPFTQFLLFPGTALIFLMIGIFMIWYFQREKND